MPSDFFADRRKGLEDAFFAEQDAVLRRRLREDDEANARRAALTAASGIADTALLDRLHALGITPATLAALSLTPLAVVAWADGAVDERERAAALSGAGLFGFRPGDAGYKLLDSWLTRRPSPELLSAWRAYVAVLLPGLGEQERVAFRTNILARTQAVAEAAGALLGVWPRVSDSERAALAEVERCLTPS